MMDRYCEFCVNSRSVVYCKADAAYLCLSCDHKVHSANPLSKRHHRTLICDTCRHRPTFVRCYDHHKFMCHACDLSQHRVTSQHQKRVMTSYVGCPSAQDLGALWGFDLSRFVDSTTSSNLGSNSIASANTSVVGLETDVDIKEMHGSIQAFFTLQQLVDLLRVQPSDVDRISSFIRCQEHKVESDVNHTSQQLVLDEGCPDDHNMIPNPCLSPLTQLEHLESETDETRIQEDSFWQCKSRIRSSQLWSQNMQDLGVCEEPSFSDDLNIPDIDLTFRNFEEVFKIEQEPTTIDKGTFISTSFTDTRKKACYTSQIMSISQSSASGGAESSGTIFGISHSIEHHKSVSLGGKKRAQLIDPKQGHCGFRKARSDIRKRIKSRSWKFESNESVTRSC